MLEIIATLSQDDKEELADMIFSRISGIMEGQKSLTRAEATDIIGVSDTQIRNLIKDGKLNPVKGKFDPKEVDFCRRNRRKSGGGRKEKLNEKKI